MIILAASLVFLFLVICFLAWLHFDWMTKELREGHPDKPLKRGK